MIARPGEGPGGSAAPPDGQALPTGSAPPATPAVAVAPRQRWRCILRIEAQAAPGGLPSAPNAWAELLGSSGLPLAGAGGSRGRAVVAAPLPLGTVGEREVVDLLLGERLSVVVVRAALRAVLPPTIELVDLYDVWLGAPAAPADVVAADYRLALRGAGPAEVRSAAEALLAARSLPRERRREKKPGSYDLRPLLLDLAVEAPGAGDPSGATAIVRARLRHGVDGVGRPDEVVAALTGPPATESATPLEVLAVVRERLILAGDPGDPGAPEPSARPSAGLPAGPGKGAPVGRSAYRPFRPAPTRPSGG